MKGIEVLNVAALLIGYLAIGAMAFGLGRLAVEVACAFVRACSGARFFRAVARKNDVVMPARKFPRFFLGQWRSQIIAKSKIEGPGGYWLGVGNWRAFKSGEADE